MEICFAYRTISIPFSEAAGSFKNNLWFGRKRAECEFILRRRLKANDADIIRMQKVGMWESIMFSASIAILVSADWLNMTFRLRKKGS